MKIIAFFKTGSNIPKTNMNKEEFEKLYTGSLDIPFTYRNWKAKIEDKPLLRTTEYPLFTDARITGNFTEGPYQFVNLNLILGPIRRHDGRARTRLLLRLNIYIEPKYFPEDDTKSHTKTYHGGWPQDEITALSSLALGIRLKVGEMSREFIPGGNPYGMPLAPSLRSDPVFLRDDSRPILPAACCDHTLKDLETLTILPKITSLDASALIKAARLYQNALWIAESETSLAWLMLVSAVETAANHWRKTEDTPPLERLKISKPKLVQILKDTGIEDLPEKVADCLADTIGSTKKFTDFIMEFLPEPPSNRPNHFQHPWECKALKKTMKTIYSYRSKALHDGSPFPLPMCRFPREDPPEEKPTGGSYAMGSSWLAKDIPMMFHTFEYIVRKSLLKWWESMTSECPDQLHCRSGVTKNN